MKALIFFDINGTLIMRDARTDLPFGHAVNKLLKTEDAMAGVDTSARSDQDVFMEILANHGLAYNEDLWQEFLGLYEDQLKLFEDTDVWRENADAKSFVEALDQAGYYLALITGELEIGAEYKLKKLGLWDYFKTGGYGQDGLKRFDIADAAKKKADMVLPRDYDEVYVIGDTVLDIQTARHMGAKIISITTGSHSRDKLMEYQPDYIIDRFEEIKDLFIE